MHGLCDKLDVSLEREGEGLENRSIGDQENGKSGKKGRKKNSTVVLFMCVCVWYIALPLC